MTRSKMVFERFWRVVAVDSAGAIRFAREMFGVPPERKLMAVDGGPAGRPEKYKPEAREWHVYRG